MLYAGTYKGKLYKTTDGGESWFFSSQGIQDRAIVYSIGIDPQNTQTVYITTRGISNNGDQSISVDPFYPTLVYFCTTTHGVLRAYIGN